MGVGGKGDSGIVDLTKLIDEEGRDKLRAISKHILSYDAMEGRGKSCQREVSINPKEPFLVTKVPDNFKDFEPKGIARRLRDFYLERDSNLKNTMYDNLMEDIRHVKNYRIRQRYFSMLID